MQQVSFEEEAVKADAEKKLAKNISQKALKKALKKVSAKSEARRLADEKRRVEKLKEAAKNKQMFLLKQIRRLVHGLRLISGFSNFPVPPSNRRLAKILFHRFMDSMVEKVRITYNNFTRHGFLHQFEDLDMYGCHLDRNAAYPFENEHQRYNKRVRPGPKPGEQLV